MDPVTKGAAFVAAWAGVKVFCVDFLGVALVRLFRVMGACKMTRLCWHGILVPWLLKY